MRHLSTYFMGFIAVVFFLTGTVERSNATHVAGMDLTYDCLGGNQYEVELVVYRDCEGIALYAPDISITSNNAGYSNSVNITQTPNSPTEITNPCNNVSSSCQGGSATGIEKYVFRGTVTLPSKQTDWVFSWDLCCRNSAITTSSGGNSYIEATLDNVNSTCNSSPDFGNDPISFFCVNQNSTYNHGVDDSDGDSLVYSLVSPKTNSSSSVSYYSPFSATNPLNGNPSLTIDQNTGDLNVTPTSQEVSIMAVKVEEYRNGKLIGSVTRDMQIYVNNCANNTLPTASGIDGTSSYSTTAKVGQQLCFDIYSSDPDSLDNVSMSWDQGIPNGSFTTTGGNRPDGTFCWTPQSSDISNNPHSFTVTVKDDACPQNGIQTYSYTIDIQQSCACQISNTSNGGLAFTNNQSVKSMVGDSANVRSQITTNPKALGPANADFNGNSVNDVIMLTNKNTIKLWDQSAGVHTTIDISSNPAQAQKTRLTSGTWNGKGPSIFYTDQNQQNIYRVKPGSNPSKVKYAGNGTNAIAGIADINGNGNNELIFADGSQQLRYLDNNNTIHTTGVTVGSNNGIGVGQPADFNGDGKASIPIVHGGNEIYLLGPNGKRVTINPGSSSKKEAKKAPVSPVDVDCDGNLEVVYIKDDSPNNNALRFVDDVRGSNTLKYLHDTSNNKVTASDKTGIVNIGLDNARSCGSVSNKWSNQQTTASDEQGSIGSDAQDGAKTQLEAFPNPFTNNTTITISPAQNDFVTVELYNASGEKISQLFRGDVKSGQKYTARVDGEQLSSGLYFCKLQFSNGRTKVKKLVHNR